MIKVDHIAKLARIGLSKQEKKKYEKQFSDILEFVNQLKEVKTSKVEPISQIIGLENVARQDKARKKEIKQTNKLLDLVPNKQERQIKVKAVLK